MSIRTQVAAWKARGGLDALCLDPRPPDYDDSQWPRDKYPPLGLAAMGGSYLAAGVLLNPSLTKGVGDRIKPASLDACSEHWTGQGYERKYPPLLIAAIEGEGRRARK